MNDSDDLRELVEIMQRPLEHKVSRVEVPEVDGQILLYKHETWTANFFRMIIEQDRDAFCGFVKVLREDLNGLIGMPCAENSSSRGYTKQQLVDNTSFFETYFKEDLGKYDLWPGWVCDAVWT